MTKDYLTASRAEGGLVFSKNDLEIEPAVLHTINPMNFTKCVTTFSLIFDFSLIDFYGKIFDFFSSQIGNALWVYRTIYKVKTEEKIFLVEIWLPSQNAGTRVSLLYISGISQAHLRHISGISQVYIK